MFERFTTDARQIVVHAQEVARESRSGSIGTGEMLVALLDNAVADVGLAEPLAELGVGPAELAGRVRHAISGEEGLDASALASVGIDLGAVRRKADATFGEGALGSARRRDPGPFIPFTPGAKQALELALREASRLKSGSIGARHLMLGILDSTDATARALLVRAVRAAGQPDEADPAPRIESLRHALRQG